MSAAYILVDIANRANNAEQTNIMSALLYDLH